MEKKSVAIILGIILVFIGLFIGGQYLFAHADAFLNAFPTRYTDLNQPPDTISIRNITEEDFSRYPVLHDLIENRRWITITDDPFLIMKVGESHITKTEASEILTEFADDYLYWNKTYYYLTQVFV